MKAIAPRRLSLLPSLAAAFLVVAAASAASASAPVLETFSYIPEGSTTAYSWGTGRTETYDVAIRVDNPDLVGRRLSTMEVQFLAGGCEDCYVWLSSQLRTRALPDGTTVNAPDYIQNYYGKPCCGTVSKILEDRFIIPEGGFYIGFTFRVARIANWLDEEPVCVFKGKNDNGFFFHSSQTYPQWTNLNAATGYVCGIRYNVWTKEEEDGSVAVELTDVHTTYALPGQKATVEGTLVNPQGLDISSVTYDWRVGDTPAQQHVPNGQGTLQVGSKASRIPVAFQVDAPAQPGEATAMVSVNKVGNEANVAAARVSQFSLVTCQRAFTRTPVVEEYTGTWCGYCPRGAAALERLAAQQGAADGSAPPVTLSYHFNDPMALAADLPAPVTSYPDTYVDRACRVQTDYGSIAAAHARRAGASTVASVSASASWDADMTAIDCRAVFTVGADLRGADLRPVYILTADGLTGQTPGWAQANYLSGETVPDDDPYLQRWADAPDPATGVTYDNVVVHSPSYEGRAGTFPATLQAGQELTDQAVIPAADIVNRYGGSLLQDPSRLRLAVLLVDAADPAGPVVVNAASVPVTGAPQSGVSAPDAADAADARGPVYNLQGICVRPGSATLEGLPAGTYIHLGRKVRLPR